MDPTHWEGFPVVLTVNKTSGQRAAKEMLALSKRQQNLALSCAHSSQSLLWESRIAGQCHLLQPSVAGEAPQQLPGQEVPVPTPNPLSHPCHEGGHHCPGCAAEEELIPAMSKSCSKGGSPHVQGTHRLSLPA